MNNPSNIAILVFVLVLFISLLFQWRQKSKKKQGIINPNCTPVPESILGDTSNDELAIVKYENNGFTKIRQFDPVFDENQFRDHATNFYLQFQASRSQRNITELREQMTEEMFASLKVEEDRLAAEGNAHEIDNISVRSVELLDAWQEDGRDFIKVRYIPNFMNYGTEEKEEDQICGVMGEKIDHVKDWIFSRISGANPWYLSGIESV